MLKVFNVIGVIVLLLLLRKLIWCLRWLWCWKHDRETPPPIGWLPSRDGGRFDAEGFLTTYHTAWYCPDCKKMTIDAADLQTEAERNQAAFPVGAEETASQSDEAKEGE